MTFLMYCLWVVYSKKHRLQTSKYPQAVGITEIYVPTKLMSIHHEPFVLKKKMTMNKTLS